MWGEGAVYQRMLLRMEPKRGISMAGTAPRFRPKPLFLAGLPIPFPGWATGTSQPW